MDPEAKNLNRRLEINKGIKEGKSGIDRSYEDANFKGLVKGVAIMTKGNVSDSRQWEIDDDTLDQIVAAGKAQKNMGLKSRFGHPNMSTTALGTFLGRMKNFYKDGDIARADLYLSRTAYETPDGDLATYILNLAEKDPDAFGTSVVLGDFELAYRIEKDGTRKKDKEGKEMPPLLRVKTLMAVDVVDDPAANNSLFGKFFNSSIELSAKATDFLDKLLNNPDSLDYVIAFLERFRVNRITIDKEKGKDITNKLQKEGLDMELKDLTLEILKKDRADLVSSIETEAIKSERARVLSIVKAAHTEFKDMGMEALVEESIEKGNTIDASLAAMRGKRLTDLNAAANKAPGADDPEKNKEKGHLDKAKEYQKEHKCTLVEALRATAPEKKKEN